MGIKPYIEKERDYLIGLRRYFHTHPEPSLEEYGTAKRIEEELDQTGIPHRRVGETGIYAWIDGEKGDGRTIALRADTDALRMQDLKEGVPYRSQNEGVCHACGHDAHTAMLLTAAKVLWEKRQEFAGHIRLFFQQAEEIGAGARIFVQEGLMEGVDRVYGSHVASRMPAGVISLTPGPNNASCDYFRIRITGKGAHVSTPHLGVDALYIASQIVVNLQSIVARQTDPLDTVVVGIGKLTAGTAYNIVAEHAEIEGTTRSFTPETRERTNRRVKETAESLGRLYGAEVEVFFQDFAAPLINDEEVVRETTETAGEIYGAGKIIHDLQKSLGADDFADYLAKAKGVYAFLGTCNPENPNTGAAQHHGLFDVDEEALLLGCNMYVDYALDFLSGRFEA